MVRDSNNMIPVTMALLLHVLLFGALFVVVDLRASATPVVPLAIKGTLIPENAAVQPPTVVEPPPPEPDTSEQDRLRAEELKRLEDARVERDRLSRIKKAEEEAAAERQRVADAEKRRKDDEARKERERQEAERLRLVEIERQRQENERERQAEIERNRQAELDAESSRLEAMQASAKQAYMYAIQSRVMNRWVRPASATVGMECVANIKQLPGGEVVSVSIGQCNGDATVQQSIVNAIHRASPLPTPKDPSVFEREIRLTFRPDED